MFKEGQVKLAIAPIGWTNDDMPELGGTVTFEQCISEMALAGFSGSEVGNKYPRDPVILNKYLSIRGLEIASAWFSSFLTSKPFEETAEDFKVHRDFLHAMGAKVIVVSEQGNSIQGQMDTALFENKPVFSEEEWTVFLDGIQRLGDLAAEKEMKLVYHHHMGTGVQTTEEITRLMEGTDPNKVSLLYDTGHLVFSGEDYLEVLTKYMDRIHHVHLKDVRADVAQKVRDEKVSFLQGVKQGVFTVPGDGLIDFKPIFKLLSEANYEGWFVVEAEQDPAIANPFEYAVKARKYIRENCGL
ncbi:MULTISPECIES: myo-inosose-2 dehydratase [Metabacillus]|uniref:Inosose dehydratase n=1 Tax=Metabacillus endolithicus TaxID=1535204 RepID=A0ABW5C752_9BACI|nr:myo-inosose-2 dehydratase [Metabacillus endolithicus]UPG61964.1 myo-inosose-2 dehydratase [Metabacillus endolithicus]